MDFLDLPYCYIQQDKPKSVMLADGVIAGAGQGKVLVEPAALAVVGTPVFIGPWPTTVPLLLDAHRRRRPFAVVDNGYFSPYRKGGYFRVTSNAMQWDGRMIHCGPERFAVHDLTLSPWQQSGGHILIVLQSDHWFGFFGLALASWLARVTETLQAHTDRPIRIRAKPPSKLRKPRWWQVWKPIPVPQRSLAEDLEDCWAVVGLSSNAMVEAVLAGVPVFPLAPCAASPMGTDDLTLIESPRRPDNREHWAWGLAANQWTIEEFASGRMATDLKDRYSPAFAPWLA